MRTAAPFDVMAWMQKAYIDARPLPWYRKVILKIKLFIDRHFKRVRHTPGAKIIDETLAQNKSIRETIKEAAPKPMNREQLARMWDSL